MLLETPDIRTNDILIFSENVFDFYRNFKIVFKREASKKPHSISYFDVCEIISDPNPKNIIVYRLLTNVNDLDAYSTKYGYFLRINGHLELIYFDPVFAIHDLKHLRFDFNPDSFRFKIQQIGLSNYPGLPKQIGFEEVYGFDLNSVEAEHQNDKVYADAIFAFAPGYDDEEEEYPQIEKSVINNGMKFKIAEEVEEEHERITKLELTDEKKSLESKEERISYLKNILGIDTGNDIKYNEDQNKYETVNSSKQKLTEYLNNQKTYDGMNKSSTLIDLFKDPSKVDGIKGRKASHILRFEK